jgi:hypothetical protein
VFSQDRPQAAQNQPHTSLRRKTAFALLGVVWLAVVLAGFWQLGSYAGAEGPTGAPPAQWPASARVVRPSGEATLIVFAHPHCPCTRASVSELARLVTTVHGRLETYVLVYQPSSQPAAWAETDVWRSAAAIPGVTVLADRDGAESKRFGVNVSGHTLVYDRNGRLAFSGGITAARGHEGDNDGRSAIAEFVTTGSMPIAHTPVFGCFLRPAEKS